MAYVYVVEMETEDGIQIAAICATLDVAEQYMKENPLGDHGYYPEGAREVEVIEYIATDAYHLWYGSIRRRGEATITRGEDRDMKTEMKDPREEIRMRDGTLMLSVRFVAKTAGQAQAIVEKRRDELVAAGEWVYRE